MFFKIAFIILMKNNISLIILCFSMFWLMVWFMLWPLILIF